MDRENARYASFLFKRLMAPCEKMTANPKLSEEECAPLRKERRTVCDSMAVLATILAYTACVVLKL